MKFYDAKDSKLFRLTGSKALHEDGYKRLSLKDRETMKNIYSAVATFSTHSSGISLRFKTNSQNIKIKAKLEGPAYMAHMTAIGQAGFDSYVYDEKSKKYIFHKISDYDFKESEYESELGFFQTRKERSIIINFPLYIAVDEVQIGLDDDAYAIPLDFGNQKKIAVYGTSITQGATATRPGLSHMNILSRWFDMEIFNYGFSGCALLEKEIAEIIAKMGEVDLFIIDAQANAGVKGKMDLRLDPFIETYRKYHPNTKIIVASRIYVSRDNFNKEMMGDRKFFEKFIKEYVENKRLTDENVFYLNASKSFGRDYHERTVDGLHPNDLGSMEMAKYYYKEIKKVL